MVILPSPTTFTVKETSLLTFSHILPLEISLQDSTKYLKSMDMKPT